MAMSKRSDLALTALGGKVRLLKGKKAVEVSARVPSAKRISFAPYRRARTSIYL